MLIETRRLSIQPLTLAQLELFVVNDGSLEKQLLLTHAPKEIHPDVLDAVQQHFLRLLPQQTVHFFYYTLWVIIEKTHKSIVGDLCFKGPPDEEGTVEIGYGTHKEHRQKGYMTEAMSGLVTWCQTQPNILNLIAETETGNQASEKLLERNHFQRNAQTPVNCWWKLSPKDK